MEDQQMKDTEPTGIVKESERKTSRYVNVEYVNVQPVSASYDLRDTGHINVEGSFRQKTAKEQGKIIITFYSIEE